MMRVASLSDDSDDFLAALFAQEVPEIAAGTVEIRAIARIPGRRIKVAVRSDDAEMDAVGACVGHVNAAVTLRIYCHNAADAEAAAARAAEKLLSDVLKDR